MTTARFVLVALWVGSCLGQTYRFNLGGPTYVDRAGNTWLTETGTSYRISGANSFSSGATIAGTQDSQLFDQQIWFDGNIVWSFPYDRPTNKYFNVSLLFAEVWSGATTPGVRNFDIIVEGITFYQKFDITNVSGYRTAYTFGPVTVQACGAKLDVMLKKLTQNPTVSGIFVTNVPTPPGPVPDCPPVTPAPPAPTFAKYAYSELLHKIFYYYEAIRAGNLDGNPIRRPAWRLNSFKDVTSVAVPLSTARVDASGGYMESSNRMKFGLPLAFTWTAIAWGGVQYRNGYEKTGEIVYLRDAIKWAAKYFIAIHPEPNKFIGQVGNTGNDFGYCGPPEEYDRARPIYWLTTTNPGSEIAAESAAALAAGSIIVGWKEPVYAATMLQHARELYQFAKVYNGSVAVSIPNHNAYYPSSGFNDEISWAAIWLYRATGEIKYLQDAEAYHSLCCAFYSGFSFSWDDKSPGINVLLSQLTGKRKYMNLAQDFFNQWLPGDERTVAHTPGGLAFRAEWGSMRYAANTAFIMMVYADWLRTTDPNDPKTSPRYIPGTYAANLFNYAMTQINYILGDNKYNRSYIAGFGNRPPTMYYHMASYNPCIDFPLRGSSQCGSDFSSNPIPQRMIMYGGMMGGPTAGDDYTWDSRSSYVRSELTQDYTAAFSGAISKLVEYYNLGPWCGTMDMGWSHPNTTQLNFTATGVNTQQIWCTSPQNYTYTTGTTGAVVTTGVYSDCTLLNDWVSTVEGWAIAAMTTGAETGVAWSSQYATAGPGSLQLSWNKGIGMYSAEFYRILYDYEGGYGEDYSSYLSIAFDITAPDGVFADVGVALFVGNWQYQITPLATVNPGRNRIQLPMTVFTNLTDVRQMTITIVPAFLGAGMAYVDNLRLCRSSVTTAAATTGVATTAGITTAAPTTAVPTTGYPPCNIGWETGGPPTCGPNCPGTPDCLGRGVCNTTGLTPNGVVPPYCSCSTGWSGTSCSIADCPGTPDCSGHGVCTFTNAQTTAPTCTCSAGWRLADCSQAFCTGQNPECSGHGTCRSDVQVPTCDCDNGWQGNNCSEPVPLGLCPNNCTDRGVCNHGNQTCTCPPTWEGSDCSIAKCPGAQTNCNSRGRCVANNQTDLNSCVCNQGWSGPDCSIAQCPTATPGLNCTGNGDCDPNSQPPSCSCRFPWGGLDCNFREFIPTTGVFTTGIPTTGARTTGAQTTGLASSAYEESSAWTVLFSPLFTLATLALAAMN